MASPCAPKRKSKLHALSESRLLKRYRAWLAQRGHELKTAVYGKLRCDAYEPDRGNLIEAKASSSREAIRMAVGQLLDYAYQGRKTLGRPAKAALVPQKPDQDIEDWLRSLDISAIWPASGLLHDNTADGRFI